MDTSKSDWKTSWISVSLAAAQLRVTHQRVYQLIRSGHLGARKVGKTWLVSDRSVESRIALLRSESGG